MHELSLSDRLAGALWGMLAADALAAPSHWFYGGHGQVRRLLGGSIAGYVQPLSEMHAFPESIMAVSSTSGAGRGTSDGDLIGSVINHGKKQYWAPGSGYHYHCTLRAGESTLEGHMVRLMMRTLSASAAEFDADRFQRAYVEFMTRPGAHNDAYASSYHRIFFANRAAGKPLAACPGSDEAMFGHNTDTIDGLIAPTVVLLAQLVHHHKKDARDAAVRSLRTQRTSRLGEEYIEDLATLLSAVMIEGISAVEAAEEAARRRYAVQTALKFGIRAKGEVKAPVVSCGVEPSWQALLMLLAKHGDDAEACLLANANAGGENVHRGILLGAVLGARVGASALPSWLKEGLVERAVIEEEIRAFVEVVIGAHEAAQRQRVTGHGGTMHRETELRL